MITSSDSIGHICAALVSAQTSGSWVALKEHRGEKGAYASLTDMIAGVLPQLAAARLGFVQHFGAIRETAAGQVIAISTRLLHESGEWLEGTGEFPLSEGPTTKDGRRVLNPCQAGGATISYAKRYALAAMLGLPTTDDRDDADRLTLRDSEPLVKDSPPQVRSGPSGPPGMSPPAAWSGWMDGQWRKAHMDGAPLAGMRGQQLAALFDEFPDSDILMGWAADFAEGMLEKRGMAWTQIDAGQELGWPADVTGCTAAQLRAAIGYLKTIPLPQA